MSFTNPVPGATVGRTDQGVDLSAPPGAPIRAITRERLVGIIQNWYKGQPYAWFQQLNSRNQPTGTYNYAAEQAVFTVRPGQVVQAGQAIGRVAPSGTGLEVGWATPTGDTLARATSGYTEGQATPAGQSYRKLVPLGGASLAGNSSLANLWIQAGGPPNVANIMAAIAMAESGGRKNATNKNSNGTVDRGLWQINSSHAQFNPQQLLSDPLYNARAAVAVYKSQGLTAWTTYNTGAYKSFLGQGGTVTSGGYGGTRPGGDNSGQPSSSPFIADYASLRSQSGATAPPNQDVSLGGGGGPFGAFQWWLGGLTSSWNTLQNDINGANTIINDTSSFLDMVTKFFLNPLAWLRAVEFVTGILIMFVGLRASFPVAREVTDNRILRSLTSDTPLGTATRMVEGTRQGRREGQMEHYRLQARRKERQRLADRTQARGEARSKRVRGT